MLDVTHDRFAALAADEAWIGGTLIDFDDLTGRFVSTRILAIAYRAGIFQVHGIGFTCAADVRFLHIEDEGARVLTFATSFGARFTIERNTNHV